MAQIQNAGQAGGKPNSISGRKVLRTIISLILVILLAIFYRKIKSGFGYGEKLDEVRREVVNVPTERKSDDFKTLKLEVSGNEWKEVVLPNLSETKTTHVQFVPEEKSILIKLTDGSEYEINPNGKFYQDGIETNLPPTFPSVVVKIKPKEENDTVSVTIILQTIQ